MFDVFDLIIYLLAVYGALTLVFTLLGSVRGRLKPGGGSIKVVLIVKNAEEYIEYAVRKLLRVDFIEKIHSIKHLTVIDMQSEDATYEILKKMETDYSSLEVLDSGGRQHIFNDFG